MANWYRLVRIFKFAFLLINSEISEVMAIVFLAPELTAELALYPTMFVKYKVTHGMYLRIPFIEIRPLLILNNIKIFFAIAPA